MVDHFSNPKLSGHPLARYFDRFGAVVYNAFTPCAWLPGGMKTSEPLGYRSHWFAHRCLNRFESFPRRPGAGLIPHAQTLAGRLQREPDIAPAVAFARAQGLIEKADPTLWRDAAHRMDAARTDRQARR